MFLQSILLFFYFGRSPSRADGHPPLRYIPNIHQCHVHYARGALLPVIARPGFSPLSRTVSTVGRPIFAIPPSYTSPTSPLLRRPGFRFFREGANLRDPVSGHLLGGGGDHIPGALRSAVGRGGGVSVAPRTQMGAPGVLLLCLRLPGGGAGGPRPSHRHVEEARAGRTRGGGGPCGGRGRRRSGQPTTEVGPGRVRRRGRPRAAAAIRGAAGGGSAVGGGDRSAHRHGIREGGGCESAAAERQQRGGRGESTFERCMKLLFL